MIAPTDADIEDLVRRLVEKFHPERVVFFGSRCFGTPRPDSDVDLLVLMDYEGSNYRAAVELLRALRPRFPVEFVIRRAEDAAERYRLGDPVLREALDTGRVLYQRVA